MDEKCTLRRGEEICRIKCENGCRKGVCRAQKGLVAGEEKVTVVEDVNNEMK